MQKKAKAEPISYNRNEQGEVKRVKKNENKQWNYH